MDYISDKLGTYLIADLELVTCDDFINSNAINHRF